MVGCANRLLARSPAAATQAEEGSYRKAVLRRLGGMEEDRRWNGGRIGRGRMVRAGVGAVADGQQWKSTADSCNPRSLPQLDMIVMERPGTKTLKRKFPLSSRPCCFVSVFKGPPYTIHLYCVCVFAENRQIGWR